MANSDAHYKTTGPEIWQQTNGRVTAFVAGAGQFASSTLLMGTQNLSGTGGTLAGVTRYLKEVNPAIKIVLADPAGSGLYNKVSMTSSGRVRLDAVLQVKYGVMYAETEAEGKRRRHQMDTVSRPFLLTYNANIADRSSKV